MKNIIKNIEKKIAIEEILKTHDKYKNSYFYTNNGNASDRSRAERILNGSWSFRLKGKKFEITREVTITCKNFYHKLFIVVDGLEKDIRSLKKALNQL